MRRKQTIPCLMMILAPFLFPSGLQAEGLVSILPDATVAVLHQQFQVEIAVNDEIDSLMGYNVTVEFDDTYLEIVDVQEGALPANSGFSTFFRWMNPACDCDSVSVNGSILGNTVDGPGTLFTITFRAVRLGTTTVGIRESDLRNGVNEQLTHGVEDAVVLIEPPGSLVVQPAATETCVYTEFQLEIAVNDEINSLMGYNITVDFDYAHLRVLKVEQGALAENSGFNTFFRWMNPAYACDSVFVNGSILGNTVDGPGTLFTITFRAINVGTTTVGIRRSDLRNGFNESLAHSRRDAVVIIDYPTDADTPALRSEMLVNYPNPFNPSTTLALRLSDDGVLTMERDVTLEIYAVSGHKVRTLFAGALPAGNIEVPWDGKDDGGTAVAAGVYFAVARTATCTLKRKIVLVR